MDRKHAIPTLADVARHANVSTATVSRCLNAPDQVVGATRERVMGAVRELGYAPNFNARALAARRTNTVGAIIPTMENAIFARGVQAFQEELQLHGMTLLVASSSYREDLEAEQIRTLIARGADALFLIGYHRSDDVYRFIEQRGIPVIVAWVHDPAQRRMSIGFDNREAMKDLANEVLDLGHRRIGYITADRSSNDRARDRVIGVREAMTQRGLDPQSLTLIETTYSIDNGGTAFAEIMRGDDRPSVVMCGNDVLAVGAVRQAKAMGMSIPGDVSITGFDEIELADVVEPALTTVHVPHREMGRQAAAVLLDVINGRTEIGPGKAPPSIRLETHVCMRETLGPAPVGT
ncbi:MAG: LacI family DNA-binding transcriptional regulator [Rhodobiaceae bacterium]|nr:LacI family DNA-binding transcriptional regulator [Rhodobiaceae bacterium]